MVVAYRIAQEWDASGEAQELWRNMSPLLQIRRGQRAQRRRRHEVAALRDDLRRQVHGGCGSRWPDVRPPTPLTCR